MSLDYDALLDRVEGEALPYEPPTREEIAAESARRAARVAIPDVVADVERLADSRLASEFVVERNGTVRQAGASQADTTYITTVKGHAERSLFFFAKAILGRAYLSPDLHKPISDWLLDLATTKRKGLLLPRDCAKTSMVSHALPPHILIQPKETNVYFPGEMGCEQRIILCCETQARGKDSVAVQRGMWQRNPLVKAFWPHVIWDKPTRDAARWNNIEYDVPRTTDWPDPSVRTLGVDGAITGSHPSVLVKDDLISIEAANSAVTMASAVEWHRASRALINKASCLEFIIGTRWAVYDLYSDIMDNDTSVSWFVKQLIEDGVCIYPPPFGPFSPAKIKELQDNLGPLFMLNYMNSAADPSLTDFDLSQLRSYVVDGGALVIAEDARDLLLAQEADPALRAVREAQVSREHAGKSLMDVLAAACSDRERRKLSHLAGARVSVS